MSAEASSGAGGLHAGSGSSNAAPREAASPDSAAIKVVLRVRPPAQAPGAADAAACCIEVDTHNSLTVRTAAAAAAAAECQHAEQPAVQAVAFNWVAGPATTQAEFFRVVGMPTVEHALGGFNATIIACGGSHAGKTHTLVGQLPAAADGPLPAEAGLAPRLFSYLWQRMPEVQAGMMAGDACSSSLNSSISSFGAAAAAAAAGAGPDSSSEPRLHWLVRCSVLAVHRDDEVHDLLRPRSGSLSIRQDIRRGVFVEGLSERVVDGVADALAVLRTGSVAHQAAAGSHVMVSCTIESRVEAAGGLVNVRSSRLLLVDLAGAEAQQQPGCSSSTDNGLAALSSVMQALAAQQNERQHIAYGSSKLTALLQESLGGNAKTVFVGNVSPAAACLPATLHTLQLAACARRIVNQAVVNEDRRNNISGLQHKVRWLQQELALARTLAARCSTPAGSSSNRSSLDEAAMQQQQQLAPVAPAAVAAHKQLQEQQQHLRQLLQLMSELGDRNSQLEEALEFCQSERTELERSCLESRQELAAMQVSLQQAVKENKSWRHRWFKPDKGSKGQPAASLALSLPQEDSLAAAAALAAQDSSSNTAGAQDTPPQQQQQQQQQSPATHSGWRGMLKGVKRNTASGSAAAAPAPSTAAGAADTAQQEQQRQEQLQQEQEQLAQREAALARVLHVVASHVAALAPADSAADGAAEDAGGVTAQQVTQDLQDLHCMPEAAAILSSMQRLTTLHQRMQQEQQQADMPPAQPVQPIEPSKARVYVAPSELHRQLHEERQLTAQLQAQTRQLQQELLLTAASASTSTAAAAAAAAAVPRSGSPLRQSASARLTLRPSPALHHIADAACASSCPRVLFAAAGDVGGSSDSRQQRAGVRAAAAEAVVGQSQAAAADGSSSPQAVPHTAASQQEQGEIAALRVQVCALQEQLGSLQRDRSSMRSRLASARHVLAAARCSTPSSLVSAGPGSLSSPQPSFGTLPPVYGDSIDEEEAEERSYDSSSSDGSSSDGSNDGADADRAGGPAGTSAVSVSASSLVLMPSVLCCSPEYRGVARPPSTDTAASLATVGSKADEELSAHEVWAQHHRQWHDHQLHYERREQLAKAVHAAIAAGRQLDEQQTQQQLQQPAQTDVPAALQLHASLGQLLQQPQEPQSPGQHVPALPGPADVAAGANLLDGSPCPPWTCNQAAHSSCGRGSSSEVEVEPSAEAWCTSPAAAPAAAATLAEPSSTVVATTHGNSEQQPALEQQQQEQLEMSGPAWSIDDYEEEVRQLSEQLQELMSTNARLKALLQQRETELTTHQERLATQAERLEQQDQELACAEESLQDLQARLAGGEGAGDGSDELQHQQRQQSSSSQQQWSAEDFMQLVELNELLQEQLEAKDRQLQARAEEVQHLQQQQQQQPAAAGMSTSSNAADVGAAAMHAASSPTQAPQPDLSTSETWRQQQQLQEQQLPGEHSGSEDGPCQAGADQGCKTPRAMAAADADAGIAASGSPSGRQRRVARSEGSCTPAHKQEQRWQPVSPFKQLRVCTKQLRAHPHDAEVAAEQAALLHQQLGRIGLQLQQSQLEAQLADIRMRMEQQQQQQVVVMMVGAAAPGGRPLSPGLPEDEASQGSWNSCCSPLTASDQQQCQLRSVPERKVDGPANSSSRLAVSTGPAQAQATEAAAADSSAAGLGGTPRGDEEGAAAGAASASAASTPCSSAISSGGMSSCEELLADFFQDLQAMAAATHQASIFRAASASTLAPGSAQPQKQRRQQQRPATAGGDGSRQQEVNASGAEQKPDSGELSGSHTAQPAASDASPWPDAVKLQSGLQVASAFELAAARSLLQAGAVVQQLKSTLAASKSSPDGSGSRHSGVKRQPLSASSEGCRRQSSSKKQQQSPADGGVHDASSPPRVARALFDTQEGDARCLQQPLQQQQAHEAVCNGADEQGAAAACDGGSQLAQPSNSPAADTAQQRQQQELGQELVHLRGHVISLQLEMQQLRTRLQLAEASGGSLLREQLSRSVRSSVTGSLGVTVTGPECSSLARNSSDAASIGSVAVAAAAAAAAGASAAGSPSCRQVLALTSKLRELQTQALQQGSTIRQLENEVRRQEMLLKQQALAAASAGGGMHAGGLGGLLLTPRSALASSTLTPRHHGAPPGSPSVFSPRAAARSSPGALASPARAFAAASPAAAAAQGLPQPLQLASRFAAESLLSPSAGGVAGVLCAGGGDSDGDTDDEGAPQAGRRTATTPRTASGHRKCARVRVVGRAGPIFKRVGRAAQR